MSGNERPLPEQAKEARIHRLRRATGDLHEALDRRISEAGLFSDRDRYALFLTLQRRFHAEVDALHADPRLIAIAPDLPERRRLPLIDQDLKDLGFETPAAPSTAAIDPIEGLGWLYVSEGSNLGAAFLLKEAAKIGLDETYGAATSLPIRKAAASTGAGSRKRSIPPNSLQTRMRASRPAPSRRSTACGRSSRRRWRRPEGPARRRAIA